MDETALDRLLRRARRREPEALGALVDRYGPRVFGLLYRLTGSRDAAEDLLQETFLRVVRTIGRYEHAGKFEAWLFRIAANLARDRARRAGRRGETVPLDLVGGDHQAARRADDSTDSDPARVLESGRRRSGWPPRSPVIGRKPGGAQSLPSVGAASS